MADTTTRYDFPYQESTDPPDGPQLGQELAEKVEEVIGFIEDTRITPAIADIADLEDERVRWVSGVGITSSTSGVGNTETVAMTVPSFTYKANRAYKIVVSGAVASSLASRTPLFRFRKTNPSGMQIDIYRVPCISTSTHGMPYQCYFQVGGSDVTGALVLTIQGGADFNANISAAASSPASMNVFEVGPATNFGWAATLV